MDVSLRAIGFTSLYGLPYVLKFLWGPVVDHYSTKRTWTLGAQSLLVVLFGLVAWFADWPQGVGLVALALLAASMVSATNDIAIDGYYMEALDERSQARFVGYRVMAYRIAMMVGTGVIVTVGASMGWRPAYMLASLILMLLMLYHIALLPSVEARERGMSELLRDLLGRGRSLIVILFSIIAATGIWKAGVLDSIFNLTGVRDLGHSGLAGVVLLAGLVALLIFRKRLMRAAIRNSDSYYLRAFVTYVDRRGIGAILAMIILMRTGEFMLTSMVAPFMVDLGLKLHYGWISGGVGLPCSIVGAMVGGWLISRYSLRKMAFPFLALQNLTNLIYMALAVAMSHYLQLNMGSDAPSPVRWSDILLVASVHGFDQLAGGLGTAVLVTFIMQTCLPAFRAAHFAVGTGLMNISGVFSGVASGFLAQGLGYPTFFGLSFIGSLPAMVILWFVPLDELKGDSGHNGS
jgi:PAT family beta-lactamase induction signal transducer AmpG